MTRTLVAIPMKCPGRAKSRLTGHLSAEAREALTLMLFDQTVCRLRQAALHGARFDLAVVTASKAIAQRAQKQHLLHIRDLGLGLCNAAASARAWAELHGYSAVCILPGDLADPDPRDLSELIQRGAPNSVTLSPASDMGTNGLIMPVPNHFKFAYGTDSFRSHYRAACHAGLEVHALVLPSLLCDVDRPMDLGRLSLALRRSCKLELPNDRDRFVDGPR